MRCFGRGLGVRASAVAIGSARCSPNAPASCHFLHRRRTRGGPGHPSIFGGIDRKRYIIETNGAGVALVDVTAMAGSTRWCSSGTRLDGARTESPEAPTNRLYRNKRDGTFEDITERAGAATHAWSSSVCAGDYDNDGWIDLFVTAATARTCSIEIVQGRFEDVTAAAGLATTVCGGALAARSSTSIATGGSISSLRTISSSTSSVCPSPAPVRTVSGKAVPVNCGPKGLPTDTNLLYHNDGNGRFSDISERSGSRA